MLNLTELEQFVAFSRLGTLSRAAEQLHISQPTLTRTMRHIEEAFGVPLFIRRKNRIELSETGQEAARQAERLLSAAQDCVTQVQAYHRRLHTIVVESCAPAPLWSLLPLLAERFPEQTVSSRLCDAAAITADVFSGTCEIGILHEPITADGFVCLPMLRELLSVCVPRTNELAAYSRISFDNLNGYNCLLRSEIGFWTELCYQKMPASKFLIQSDDFAMRELIQQSTLPCFTTNLSIDPSDVLRHRVAVPISDPEADVMYYLLCRQDNAAAIAVAKQLQKRQRSLLPI